MNSLQQSLPLSPFPDLRSSIKIFKARRPLPALARSKKHKNIKWIERFVFRTTRLILM
jgi:hypothetical protein